MHIDSYTFGSMIVDGKAYSADLIVFPDKVSLGWWRKEGHSLDMSDLDEVMDYKPDILIIGRGASGCMDLPGKTREFIGKSGIKLIDKNTDEASRIFNEYINKKKRVVGAFHLTC